MSTEGKKQKNFTILGAGVAGLAFGYFAKEKGDTFKIYEAAKTVGGLSQTYEYKGFRFDSGAHRFHAKFPEVTKLIKELLGNKLSLINLPTQIYYKKSLLDFPLTPLNMLKKLGPFKIARGVFEVLVEKIRKREIKSFYDAVVSTYGETIGSLFLLNYANKHWGAECKNLLPEVAGLRLAGLSLKTLVIETLFGSKAKTEHIEGSFYYPKYGIGMIPDALAEKCATENINLSSPVTAVNHSENKITGIQIKNETEIAVENVVSTIPVTKLVAALNPPAPTEVLDAAKRINFRAIRVVFIGLNKKTVTNASTVTFPGDEIPFTRLYEPRNRSPFMSPEGKTSVMIEIPCDKDDKTWNMSEEDIAEKTVSKIIEIGWINREEILETKVFSIPEAYPKLTLSTVGDMEIINKYLDKFENLNILGRNGLFKYSHIHHQIRWAKELINKL